MAKLVTQIQPSGPVFFSIQNLQKNVGAKTEVPSTQLGVWLQIINCDRLFLVLRMVHTVVYIICYFEPPTHTQNIPTNCPEDTVKYPDEQHTIQRIRTEQYL